MSSALLATAAAVLVVIVCGIVISTYNRLVALKNLCDNGFAQIEVQLRRRYDLIPNLVECVKGYMSHERQTLENVIAARNQAAAGLAQATQNPGDMQQLKALIGADSALTGAMGRLSFVMEAYPELKANENVAALTEELTTTENKVSFARQAYNDWVMGYNSYRESFPVIVMAPALGFTENRMMLEMEDSAAIQRAPVVSLS